MKKLFTIGLVAAGIIFGTSSFTLRSNQTNATETKLGNVEFKITNNTSAEFKYCVNGGHNYISSGSTKSFSYSAGQDFYYVEGSNCGKQWFEVTSDMNGKEYKLTDLK
jgi:hypothetical protein